jgi:uncharacterized membrane protein YciS (DUF1049 family)
MSTPTPPNALPVISENLLLRFKLSTLIGVFSGLIGGSIFCTMFYLKVDAIDQRLQHLDSKFDAVDLRLQRLEHAHDISQTIPPEAFIP